MSLTAPYINLFVSWVTKMVTGRRKHKSWLQAYNNLRKTKKNKVRQRTHQFTNTPATSTTEQRSFFTLWNGSLLCRCLFLVVPLRLSGPLQNAVWKQDFYKVKREGALTYVPGIPENEKKGEKIDWSEYSMSPRNVYPLYNEAQPTHPASALFT